MESKHGFSGHLSDLVAVNERMGNRAGEVLIPEPLCRFAKAEAQAQYLARQRSQMEMASKRFGNGESI